MDSKQIPLIAFNISSNSEVSFLSAIYKTVSEKYFLLYLFWLN